MSRQTNLERRKLKEEIKDLTNKPSSEKRTARISLTAALLSAITPLVVAGATILITVQVQHLTNLQKKSDAFASLMKDLGSKNVSARAGAVIGLTKVAVTDEDRSKQTVTILVTQLTSETDSRVLGILIPSVESLGPLVLDDLTRANRNAYQKFRIKVFDFLTLNLRHFNEYENIKPELRAGTLLDEGSNAYQKILPLITGALDTDLLSPSEKAMLMNTFGVPDFRFDSELVARAEWLSCKPLYLKAVIDPVRPSSTISEADLNERNIVLKEIGNYARSLYVTSIVLGRLIASFSPSANTNLSSVAIYFAELNHHAILEGLNLQGAYIAGDLSDANLAGAKLSGANLQYAKIDNANLSYATLNDTMLPTLVQSPKFPNLTGADWWNAAAIKADNSTPDLLQIVTSVTIVTRMEIKAHQKSVSIRESSNCRAATFTAAEIGINTAAANTELSDFTISLCQQYGDLLRIRKDLERNFPRIENERERTEWLRQESKKSADGADNCLNFFHHGPRRSDCSVLPSQ